MASVDHNLRKPAFEISGEDVSVRFARFEFFRAVHRVHPAVVDELMGEPLELFRSCQQQLMARFPATIEERRRRGQEWPRDVLHIQATRMPYWEVLNYAGERDPEIFHRLRDRLLEWANRWRLWSVDPDDDWCLHAALDVLENVSNGGVPFSTFVFASGVPLSEAERRFSFSDGYGWMPILEEWEDAERRLDDAYKRAKKVYKERLERVCRERGLQPVPRSRHRKGNHFEWLAQYQTRGERWAWIAEEETKRLASLGDPKGVTDEAVAKAAKKKAVLIGLKLADTGPGRPPGRATS
jgi:hypothetical protein